MRRFFAGLGSLIALVAILVGVPVVLIAAAGNPLPTGDQLHSILTLTPDYGNVILLSKILPCIGWIAWALFAIPILIEILASIAGRPTKKRSWAFRGQQQVAATMIAAVLVMFAGFGGLVGPAQPASAAPAPTASTGTSLSVSRTTAAPVAATPAAAPAAEKPAPAPAPASAKTITVTHTVAPGENLWDIAEHYYGNGTRDIDIFKASTATVQADGSHLTDPNIIRPGWQLSVPGIAAPATPAPAPTPAPSSSAASQGAAHADPAPQAASPTHEATGGGAGAAEATQAPAAAAPAASASPTPSAARENAPASSTADEGMDLSIPLQTGGGIAGLLAAGLLLALSRRRLQQRRKRQSGTRIAMPEAEASNLEFELRMVEDPLGIIDIDNALRSLQIWAEDTGTVLPELFALRLESSEIALYLTEPAELPAPFVQAHPDGTAWIVKPGTAAAPSRESVSPYPALTTIGVDEHDGVLMLDLEQIGSLNIVGDDETARALLNAMAVELAENPWSDQIQVTLVGMPQGLARDLNRFRVQHVDDVAALIRNIRSDLENREQAFASYGVDDVHAARVRATDSESWAPHIVILAEAPAEDLQNELADLVDRVPRLGIATVSNGATVTRGSTVRITSRDAAELISAGDAMPALPFKPQVLDGEELKLIQELFDTTDHDAVPVTPRVTDAPIVDEPDPLTEDATQVPVDESIDQVATATNEPAEPETDVDELAEFEPETDVDELAEVEAAVEVPAWPAPYVRLLGPVDALQLADNEPMPGRGVELMAYLLLNGTVDGRQLQTAFWPDTPNASNNQRGLAKKVRVALGHSPDGELLLPENVNHQGYTLHPAIRSDWDDFRDLIGDDLSRTSNENLVAAIKLVRAQPFAGCNTKRWWQWIAIAQEEMIAAVMDAADELGRRSLKAHDADQARYAAHVAQSVDPLNEAGWRTELRAAMQAGDVEEFHRIVDNLYARVGGADAEYELDDETQELVNSGTGDMANA
jgi:hypothetical protein